MNPQLLLTFSPFLALLYVLFALFQALRGKRQGLFAALLACAAAAVALAAFVLMGETPTLRSRLVQAMLLNALITFVASLLILLVERQRKGRDPNRSYGMIGIGLSVLLALGTYVTPLLTNALPAADTLSTAAAERPDTTFQTISALTPGAVANQNRPEATEEAPEGTSDLATVLSAETGLSPDELAAQFSEGSTIAALVEANGGDLETVTEAIKAALDALVASGGRGGQLLSQLGTDTAALAEQIVQGELPAQAQTRVTTMLLGTGNGGQGGGDFQPPADGTMIAPGGNFQPPADGTMIAPGGGDFQPPADGTMIAPGGGDFAPPADETMIAPNGGDFQPPAALPTSQPSATTEPQTASEPTATIQRPTRIVFPTATPTPDAAEATAQADAETASASACTLVTNYNLNLRDQPTTDGSRVLLSIPMGTTVNADARTEDGWYHVEYGDDSGWVSGEYASADRTCTDLPRQ